MLRGFGGRTASWASSPTAASNRNHRNVGGLLFIFLFPISLCYSVLSPFHRLQTRFPRWAMRFSPAPRARKDTPRAPGAWPNLSATFGSLKPVRVSRGLAVVAGGGKGGGLLWCLCHGIHVNEHARGVLRCPRCRLTCCGELRRCPIQQTYEGLLCQLNCERRGGGVGVANEFMGSLLVLTRGHPRCIAADGTLFRRTLAQSLQTMTDGFSAYATEHSEVCLGVAVRVRRRKPRSVQLAGCCLWARARVSSLAR